LYGEESGGGRRKGGGEKGVERCLIYRIYSIIRKIFETLFLRLLCRMPPQKVEIHRIPTKL
jgi:hypothetical protein